MATPLLPRLRAEMPFRLGVTSYIYPADILPNVRLLAGRVDDVELVLFESPDRSNIPSPEIVDELVAIASANDLTFTVHFPIDRKLCSNDAAERLAMVEQIANVIERMGLLSPFAWVLHIEGIVPEDAEDASVLERKLATVRPLLREVTARVQRPSDICIENLRTPFDCLWPLVDEFGLSVCMDIGHLWLYGQDWRSFMDRYLGRTRVIHAHGIVDGKDHASLSAVEEATLDEFFDRLGNFEGVLTLEVFDFDDARTSLEVIDEKLKGRK